MSTNQPLVILPFDDDWSMLFNDSPWDFFGSPADAATDGRVCDRCILKKVKCDLGWPSCSRCTEGVHLCIYSSKKRKPGPPKGSARKQHNPSLRKIGEAVPTWTTKTRDEVEQQQPANISALRESTGSALVTAEATASFSIIEQPLITESSNVIFANPDLTSNLTSTGTTPSSSVSQFRISPNRQNELLDEFLKYINPAINLFDGAVLRRRYQAGDVDQNLVLTICAITIKILKRAALWDSGDAEGCLDWLLTKHQLDRDYCAPAMSLEHFQHACLLNFYNYNRQPGYKPWMRISQLVRKAYQYRLHQLDCGNCDTPASDYMRDKEEWRLVWWCIFRLDTYSNINSATPCVIELSSIKTALVPSPSYALTDNESQPGSPVFLAEDTQSIPETVYKLFSQGKAVITSMNIVTIAIGRAANDLHRLAKQGSSEKLRSRLGLLEQHINSVHLALPLHFTNMSRQTILNETPTEHNARLVCLIHLQMSLAMVSLSLYLSSEGPDRLLYWTLLLEKVEILTSAVAHLDTQYLSTIDPSLSFIAYGVLGFLSVHMRCELRNHIGLRTSVKVMEGVLECFLEEFTVHWDIPRVLLKFYQRNKGLLPEFLTMDEMDRMGRDVGGLLNPESLQLLRPPLVTLEKSVTSETEGYFVNSRNGDAHGSIDYWALGQDNVLRSHMNVD